MITETVCTKRKAAVVAILTEGLPAMPDHLRHLADLLAATPVDVKQVASAIRQDRQLTARLFRWSEALRNGHRSRLRRVEEAAMLMGTQRLKDLIFANYLVLLTGDRLRRSDLERFWSHSLATGLLSEVVARAVGYDDAERAYRGGVMHDSGKLPLLMTAAGEEDMPENWIGHDGRDSLKREREHFGFDHCQVGRALGVIWSFDSGLIEVLEWHHEPERARFDRDLVGIVAAADHFLDLDLAETRAADPPTAIDDVYRSCFPHLSEEELEGVVSLFEREHARVHSQTDLWSQESDVPRRSRGDRTGA